MLKTPSTNAEAVVGQRPQWWLTLVWLNAIVALTADAAKHSRGASPETGISWPITTHLLANPDACLTPIGSFLRKSSLDELPIPEKVIYPIPIPAFPFATPRSGVQGMQGTPAPTGDNVESKIAG